MLLRLIDRFGVSEADDDDLLLDCFEDHEAYLAARQHKKFLIIGRKGAGKTAIFRKLVSESVEERQCHGHSFSDYPWFHHDKQKTYGVPDAECYRYSWEYVILLSIAKMIIRDGAEPWDDASLQGMARIESFLVDTYGTKSPDLKKFFSPETVVSVPDVLSRSEPRASNVPSGTKVLIKELPQIVYEVNSALFSAVKSCIRGSQSFQVCFDELDRGFVVDDENYANRLSSLLIAARDINRSFRDEGKSASAIVFLRDDIMRHLQFEDKNKIVEDMSYLIAWDSPGTEKKLKDLMERRFARVLGMSKIQAWDAVFDEVSLMPGRQTKYQYILDRTLKRPRDMIKFCNEALRQYKLSPQSHDRFQNTDILAAKAEYSKYLKKEITDEMHKHFPEFQDAFDVIRVAGSIGFTIAAFQKAYETVLQRKALQPVSYLLKQLFEFSVIAYLKVGGTGGGSEWVWKYEDSEVEYDDRAAIFRVHSGLKETLELKQGRVFGPGEIAALSGSGNQEEDE